MTHSLPIDYISKDDIRLRAKGFLARYHPTGDVPIPIEGIVDRQLKWNLIPVSDLRRLIEIEGCMVSSMTEVRSIICSGTGSGTVWIHPCARNETCHSTSKSAQPAWKLRS